MTQYGRYTHCDECGQVIYRGEFIRHYQGQTFCEYCWRSVLEDALDDYIDRHKDELLDKVEEELEG